jgi:hypothetical protein
MNFIVNLILSEYTNFHLKFKFRQKSIIQTHEHNMKTHHPQAQTTSRKYPQKWSHNPKKQPNFRI